MIHSHEIKYVDGSRWRKDALIELKNGRIADVENRTFNGGWVRSPPTTEIGGKLRGDKGRVKGIWAFNGVVLRFWEGFLLKMG